MSPSNAFFESFVNLEHRVLGRKLQPLSLRHLLWLDKIGSPFAVTNKPLTMLDLEAAVIVCGAANDNETLTTFDVQKLPFWKRFLLRQWRKANRARNLEQEVKAFLAYYDDYLALPEFYDAKGERNDALPHLLLGAAALIKATGWDEQTVFNMPVGKVIMLNLAFGYLNTGETNVISDKEQAAQAALKALKGLTKGGTANE